MSDTPHPQTLASLAPWAMSMPDPQRLVTADELLLMDDIPGLELIEGRLVKNMSPGGGLHGRIIMHLSVTLTQYIEDHQLGEVYAAETGFLLKKKPDTVLAPDFAFVRSERVITGPDEEGYLPLAPDFAVEIVSRSQRRPQMAAKARRWLDAGTRLVWVVWPKAQRIDVWRAGETQPVTLGAGDTLEGYDVLPGFTHPVAAIFA